MAMIQRKPDLAVRIRAELYAELQALKLNSGRSIAWMVAEALRRYIRQEKGGMP